jgi:hypothetical protein
MPSPGHSNALGNALVQHPNNLNTGITRPEDPDRAFERPTPKGHSELFNPKVMRRPISGNSKTNQQAQDKADRERRGDVIVSSVFVGEVATMSLGDQGVDVTPALVQDTFSLVVRSQV